MVSAGVVLPAAEADSDQLIPVWRLASQGSFTDAQEALPATSNEAEARFTQAMLLFNRQPRSDENLVTAASLLAALAREGGPAELCARSRYFQARAEALRDPDSPEAMRLNEQLWCDFPAESYGQRGLVNMVLAAFYKTEPRDAVLTKVAELEAQAERLTDPVVRSQFHQVAARGYLHLGGADAKALAHLLQAEALGVARHQGRGDLQVSIGQLAAALGRPDIAHEHYTAFLRDWPSDPRAYTVRALLAALPAN
jgi:tetratricopeptide (TPR) repeat protein